MGGGPGRNSSRGRGAATPRGGVASRYLAAISSASQQHYHPSVHPVCSSLPLQPSCAASRTRTPSQERNPATPSTGTTSLRGRTRPRPTTPWSSSVTSPKSTRTERTYPLDQSGGEESWDEDHTNPSSQSPTSTPQHETSGFYRGSGGAMSSLRDDDPQQRHPQPGHVVDSPSPVPVILQASDRGDGLGGDGMSHQSSLSVSRNEVDLSSRLSDPASEGEPRPSDGRPPEPRQQQCRRETTSHHQRESPNEAQPSPSPWGVGKSFRFFLDAKQLFSGCEGGEVVEAGSNSNGSVAPAEDSELHHDMAADYNAVASYRHRRAPSDVQTDITTASTQVATNRAVDVAYRRRRFLAQEQHQQQETQCEKGSNGRQNHKPQHSTSSAPTHPQVPRGSPPSRTHPPRYSFGNYGKWNPAQLEAKSVLSLSSNDESSMSRAQQHPPTGSSSCASHDESSDHPSVQNRCLLSSEPPPVSDRLARHVQSTYRTQPGQQKSGQQPGTTTQGQYSEMIAACEQSESSSVGVEVNSKLQANARSTKQVKTAFQNKSVLNHELPCGAVTETLVAAKAAESTPVTVTAQVSLVRMYTKRFSTTGATTTFMSNPKCTPTSNASKTAKNLVGPLEDDECLSPPQIQRTTAYVEDSALDPDPSQQSLTSSPDPIFCTQSETSPSHSAATSSMLSSSSRPAPPARTSSAAGALSPHVEAEEKFERDEVDASSFSIEPGVLTQSEHLSPSRSQTRPLGVNIATSSQHASSQDASGLRSTSDGDMKPAYPSRAASSIFWRKRTQSGTAIATAPVKSYLPQLSDDNHHLSSTVPGSRHHAQTSTSSHPQQHPLLLPVLSNSQSDGFAAAHPAPKPRQIPYLNGRIAARQTQSMPIPQSPVDAAPCSSFLEAISRFEKKPRKASLQEPDSDPILRGHAPLELQVDALNEELEEEKTAFGKLETLPPDSGVSKVRAISRQTNPSTERTRRGISLVLGRSARSSLTFDDDEKAHDADDDTTSVKSLREVFEPPSPPLESESSVRKMRAKFESSNNQFTSRRDAANGPLKDAISMFDTAPRSKRSKNGNLSRRTGLNDSRISYVGEVDEQDDGSLCTSTVSERIRTFNRSSDNRLRQKNTRSMLNKRSSSSAAGLPATSTSSPLQEDDDLSVLSKEYDVLVSGEGRVTSSASVQHRPCTPNYLTTNFNRPRSADPMLSQLRWESLPKAEELRPSISERNAKHTILVSCATTSTFKVNEAPHSHRLPVSPQLVGARVIDELTSQSHHPRTGPSVHELAASSFIHSVEQHAAGSSTRSASEFLTSRTPSPATTRPHSAETVPSALIRLQKGVMLSRASSHQDPAAVYVNAPGPQTAPMDSGRLTPGLESSCRMTKSIATSRSQSPGIIRHSTESLGAAQRSPMVSFLSDSPERARTLQKAHEAMVKNDNLLFLADESPASTNPRASPDGAVVAGIDCTLQEPTSSNEAVDNGSQGGDECSEFSDGVTLDLSIAEVSNLTTPTALVSRADRSDEGVGAESSDQGSKSVDLVEAEAKRSEASSSQTSEAAAPLLARALGLNPRSDELSANSFFAKRALIANHWSKTSSLDNALTNDERDSKDDSIGGSGGWDLTRIESTFPLTEPSHADDSIFDFDSEWQPFPSDHQARDGGGKGVALSMFPLADPLLVDVTSRSKTPTRSNISARARGAATKVTANTLTPRLARKPVPTALTPPLTSVLQSVAKRQDKQPSHQAKTYSLTQKVSQSSAPVSVPQSTVQAVGSGASALTPKLFSRTHPQNLQPPSSSGEDPSFWKRRTGATLSSLRKGDAPTPVRSIERLPVRFPSSSPSALADQRHSSARPSPPASIVTSTASTALPSTTSTALTERAGNHHLRHAAVMDRLRSLKEARLRRMVGYRHCSPAPSSSADNSRVGAGYRLPDPDDTDNSTQSSTQFGGSTFLASLEVD